MGSRNSVLLEKNIAVGYYPLWIPTHVSGCRGGWASGHIDRRDHRNDYDSIRRTAREVVEDLGAESTIHSKPYKTAVAVSTVVIFGTLSMFLYPILYRNGVLSLSSDQMGLYIGSTLHEVAHVVGAGNALGEEVSGSAIIVKMIRVMMLVPVLLIVGYSVSAVRAANRKRTGRKPIAAGAKGRLAIPWFALGFLAVIAFNSFDLLPHSLVNFINALDTFLLTMAMTALGAETSIEKFRKAGARPFVLALLLYVWLLGGGYLLVKYLVPVLI